MLQRQKEIMGKFGEAVAIEKYISHIKMMFEPLGYKISSNRAAPFDTRSKNFNTLPYDYYIKYSNEFDEDNFLLEVKSRFEYQGSDNFSISREQIERYQAYSKENNIDYIFLLVDFHDQIIYKVPMDKFLNMSIEYQDYFSFLVEDKYIFCTFEDKISSDLNKRLLKVQELDKNNLFNL